MKPGLEWLNSVEIWVQNVRDIYPLFVNKSNPYKPMILEMDYDIDGWLNNKGKESISNYKIPTKSSLVANQDDINSIVSAMTKMYGPNPMRWLSRVIEVKPLKDIWKKNTHAQHN
jgi:hypothetical protein